MSRPLTSEPSAIGRVVAGMLATDAAVTLLSVCPNSEAVARAALLAAQRADAPMMFAATLNQVDVVGGYTGWSPSDFTAYLNTAAATYGVTIPILVGLDHGGPWTKDQHYSESWTFEDTMGAARKSLEACLDAGYNLLHIDATVDPTADGEVALDTIIVRTINLMEHAETYRLRAGIPPVGYEVGTEEVHGGMADRRRFVQFVEMLEGTLADRYLLYAWPVFFVGRVGTDLHTTTFDATEARALAEVVRPRGSTVKGHYTDYVENPADYPSARVGGANVGPEFADVEVTALLRLCEVERRRGGESGFEDALRTAVVESGRWKKWLTSDERDLSFDELPEERRDWLTRTGSRYVWRAAAVVDARRRLYDNVKAEVDPDKLVVEAIAERIELYISAFNLAGFASQVRRWVLSSS